VTPDSEAPTPHSENLSETTSDTGDADVKATASSQLPTPGERLVREARRIASSHVPAYPWLRLLDPVIKRVSSLPVPSQSRFQRTEVSPVAEFSRPVSHEPFAEAGVSWEGQLFPYPDAREQPVEGEAGGWRQSFSQPTVSESLSERSSQADGQPLSPYVQQRLRDFVGPGSEAIRVHTDETAEAITHARRADAVTVGEQVFFRQGRFRPHEDEGFALLAHEAMHVIQAMRPGSAWRRATHASVEEEEQEASIQERNVLHARRTVALLPQSARHPAQASRYPALPERQATVERSSIRSGRGLHMPEPAAASSAASTVYRPMTAPMGRSTDDATPLARLAPDIEDLKRTLYRDLMMQIRVDLERGG
jgi:Domain of unknown function (DUF4157)